MKRPQKITLGEMRASRERGLVVSCPDYRCSHNVELAPAVVDQWDDDRPYRRPQLLETQDGR